jgi:hypothetical protein
MTKTRRKESGVQAFPLAWPQGWPRTPANARESGYQFTETDFGSGARVPVSLTYAYGLLREELMRLKAANVVVSWNYRHDQYGFPIETEFAVKDHGVAVYFTLNGRAMVMACDRYQRAAANLRSLGLALEAMRQLARHGGGVMMERAFAGFTALPRPPSCWDVLGVEERCIEGRHRTGVSSSREEDAPGRRRQRSCHGGAERRARSGPEGHSCIVAHRHIAVPAVLKATIRPCRCRPAGPWRTVTASDRAAPVRSGCSAA